MEPKYFNQCDCMWQILNIDPKEMDGMVVDEAKNIINNK